MITTLQLGNQEVRIVNGELVGYKVQEHQFIHQKGSPGWGSADTEMFPIIGPVNQAGYQVKTPRGMADQEQHGHLRQFPYQLVKATNTQAVFKKEYQANTAIKNGKYPDKSAQEWLQWPYTFSFEKHFNLSADGLEISFHISGEAGMPYMLGYHPAFKLHTAQVQVQTQETSISLDQILAVGSRALEVADHQEITLVDGDKAITIKTEGFGHFMCWTEVRNMLCIEPITFYPYAAAPLDLHKGFRQLKDRAVLKTYLSAKG